MKKLVILSTIFLGIMSSITAFNAIPKTNLKENSFIDYKQISAGISHTFFVKSYAESDHLYTWGKNDSGQLGLGDDVLRKVPTEINKNYIGLENGGTIKQVFAGRSNNSAVITTNKTGDHLYIWGNNDSGQLGLGDDELKNYKNTPQELDIDGGAPGYEGVIKQVALGDEFSAVITNDGTSDHLYTWGNNYYGQLGLGDNSNKNEPTEVNATNIGLENWGTIKDLGLGSNFSSIITNDGTKDHLYTWGNNYYGQLGIGNNTFAEMQTPQEVYINDDNEFGIKNTIKQLDLGDEFSAVITNDGKNDYLYTWGKNDSGQLGLGDNSNRDKPTEVNATKVEYRFRRTIKDLDLGANYSSIITNDGKKDHLYTWGNNSFGQLGLGDVFFRNTPTEVNTTNIGLENVDTIKQVALGKGHSAIITKDKKNDNLYTWGKNDCYELGLGNNEKYYIPTLIFFRDYDIPEMIAIPQIIKDGEVVNDVNDQKTTIDTAITSQEIYFKTQLNLNPHTNFFANKSVRIKSNVGTVRAIGGETDDNFVKGYQNEGFVIEDLTPETNYNNIKISFYSDNMVTSPIGNLGKETYYLGSLTTDYLIQSAVLTHLNSQKMDFQIKTTYDDFDSTKLTLSADQTNKSGLTEKSVSQTLVILSKNDSKEIGEYNYFNFRLNLNSEIYYSNFKISYQLNNNETFTPINNTITDNDGKDLGVIFNGQTNSKLPEYKKHKMKTWLIVLISIISLLILIGIILVIIFVIKRKKGNNISKIKY